MFAIDFPTGRTIAAFGRTWHFSYQALRILEKHGPITEGALQFTAILLIPAVETSSGPFEVDYYGQQIRGELVDGAVTIDAGQDEWNLCFPQPNREQDRQPANNGQETPRINSTRTICLPR